MKRPNRSRLRNWWKQSQLDKDTKTMRTYTADILKAQKDNPRPERRDMLYALMNGKDPETGEGLSETQIIDEIVTMPIGASIAPSLISTAMCYLAKSPEVFSKVREEVDWIIRGGPFTHDKIEELVYRDAVVKESLRLSAAAPGFKNEPLPDTKGPITLANGKYEIPARQRTTMVLAAVNRDQKVFDRPIKISA